MKIGFATIYGWRPHVEHAYFLSGLARQAGHEVAFLSCDGDLPSCYTKEMRPNRWGVGHCVSCRLGGIRTFTGSNVESLGALSSGAAQADARSLEWAYSSASTLGRFESDEDYSGPEFLSLADRLAPAASRAYAAAKRWIDNEALDAVCVFNGRMDATRAVMEAAKDASRRFISLERTWFGDGLQLLPDESCLGLLTVNTMMVTWRDRPLLKDQALVAAGQIASRFLRSNVKEWRAYNVAATHEAWPASNGALRLLFLPGSRNEVLGHPDWADGWGDKTRAYDAILAQLGGRPVSALVRCHPNWAERIGMRDGAHSERHFTDWARKRGIRVIGSMETASTTGLIDQADAVVVAGSSAGLEAGILGRQVIAVSPSIYGQAGFQETVYEPDQVAALRLDADLRPAEVDSLARDRVRRTLRFAYSMIYRLPQYVKEVHCATTTRYEYRADADPQRFLNIVRTGQIEADDDRYADNLDAEEEVLDMIAGRDWQQIAARQPETGNVGRVGIRRRFPFSIVQDWRDSLPRGDFWR